MKKIILMIVLVAVGSIVPCWGEGTGTVKEQDNLHDLGGPKRRIYYEKKVLFEAKNGSGQGEFNLCGEQGLLTTQWIRLAVDKKEDIYILDIKNNRIQKYNKTGDLIKIIPVDSYNQHNDVITRKDSNGTVIATYKKPSKDIMIDNIYIDNEENIFADKLNYIKEKKDADGIYSYNLKREVIKYNQEGLQLNNIDIPTEYKNLPIKIDNDNKLFLVSSGQKKYSINEQKAIGKGVIPVYGNYSVENNAIFTEDGKNKREKKIIIEDRNGRRKKEIIFQSEREIGYEHIDLIDNDGEIYFTVGGIGWGKGLIYNSIGEIIGKEPPIVYPVADMIMDYKGNYYILDKDLGKVIAKDEHGDPIKYEKENCQEGKIIIVKWEKKYE